MEVGRFALGRSDVKLARRYAILMYLLATLYWWSPCETHAELFATHHS